MEMEIIESQENQYIPLGWNVTRIQPFVKVPIQNCEDVSYRNLSVNESVTAEINLNKTNISRNKN